MYSLSRFFVPKLFSLNFQVGTSVGRIKVSDQNGDQVDFEIESSRLVPVILIFSTIC